MQPHKPTEQIAERSRSTLGVWALVTTCLVHGCIRSPLPAEDDDSQPLADVPADLPVEPIEFEGILYAVGYPNAPTQFRECETAEVFEMSYVGAVINPVWSGSCDGVYNRVRGTLDRSFDPPRLIIEETLEARWSEPSDCAFFFEPDYISCYWEDEEETFICEPAGTMGCDEDSKCNPIRFFASEFAGWRHHKCTAALGDGAAGDTCEYPDGGDQDTCAKGNRCWNPTADLTAPGICVPYCDLTGEVGLPCEGTCVRCSSSDKWGLCMTECSGEDCNIDAFC